MIIREGIRLVFELPKGISGSLKRSLSHTVREGHLTQSCPIISLYVLACKGPICEDIKPETICQSRLREEQVLDDSEF